MVSLLELLLSELAGHHRSAGRIHSIGEVLAGQANPSPLPALKLTCVDVFPLVHSLLVNGTDVLMHPMAPGQVPSTSLWWLWARSPSASSHRTSRRRKSSHWPESIPLTSGHAMVDHGSAFPGSLCRCLGQRSQGRCHDSRGFKNPTG